MVYRADMCVWGTNGVLNDEKPRIISDFYTGLFNVIFYTENDDPQPQVVDALGLRITNWEPCRLSV